MITDRFTFTSSKIGFPMLSRTTLRDDMFCIAYMRRTVPGGLWCEMSLEPGAVIAYSRSAEHTARNPVGTQFMFVITDQEQYDAFIAEYDVSPLRYFRAWAFGEAHRQLIHNESNSRTVTEMATGLGFVHLSRFAGSYRQLYGEPPAATLRAAH